MAKQKGALSQVWGIVAWVTGVLVSLAVGFGMVNETLPVKYIPTEVTAVAGWIVVILTLLGVILAMVDQLGK